MTPAAQRHAHQIAALTALRDQILSAGHPADSVELTDLPEYGAARLTVRFGDDVALYIDVTESSLYEIGKGAPSAYGRAVTPAAADIDADGALRVYRSALAEHGLPARDSAADRYADWEYRQEQADYDG